jgi:hypothetical protein
MKIQTLLLFALLILLVPTRGWTSDPSVDEMLREMALPLAFEFTVDVTTINPNVNNPAQPGDYEVGLGIRVASGEAMHIIDWDAGPGGSGDKQLIDQNTLLLSHYYHHYTTTGQYVIKVYGCVEDYVELIFDKHSLTGNKLIG